MRGAVGLLILSLTLTVQARKNVLFLVSDDMRPQLGVYQNTPYFPDPVSPRMHTPNLDALASKSLLLQQAFVQQAVCSPSRASLLTGRRPDTTHVTDLYHYWREVGGNYTTIPQYFKEQGYITAGFSKIFHPGRSSGHDDPISWTEPYYHPDSSHEPRNVWKAVPEADWKKFPLVDQQTTKKGIEALRKAAPKARNGEQPFFIAIGYLKPHLPFVFPDKFLEYYPLDNISVPDNMYAPSNLPLIAWSNMDELRGDHPEIGNKYGYGGMNTTFLPTKWVKDLRRAYYAAVSYVDDLIGQVLKELEDLGLANNTVVSFWGDHGWQLGEHAEWCKHTNFEIATHAPMMVRVPGLTDEGIATNQLTEFVDLFPSLAEAAGLPPVPLCPEGQETKVTTCTEGVSFLPLAKMPQGPWKKAVFSQYPRMATDGNIYMGYSMRTARYRYTEWVTYYNWPEWKTPWGAVFHGNGAELYDHKIDPQENYNRAFDHDYKEIRQKLSKKLRKGWRHALPGP